MYPPKITEESLMLEMRTARARHDSYQQRPKSTIHSGTKEIDQGKEALAAQREAAQHYGRALNAFHKFKKKSTSVEL